MWRVWQWTRMQPVLIHTRKQPKALAVLVLLALALLLALLLARP